MHGQQLFIIHLHHSLPILPYSLLLFLLFLHD